MSYSFSYSIDDDPFSSAPSPAVTSSDEVRLRGDRPTTSTAAARQSSRQSGEWSTRLSTGGSTSGGGSSGRRDATLPPTRLGVLKPEDTLKVDAFRLVKPESSPLSITAIETLSALEKQKQAQKETKTFKNTEESDIDWEQNLSSWKSRRKSKSSYQSKGLELGDDNADDSAAAGGKKSKTFKELMDQKEKRSNGHSMYTYENQENPKEDRPTLPSASFKRETQSTTTETKYGDLPKRSEPLSGRVSAEESSTGSHSTSRHNFTDSSNREPRAPSVRTSELRSEVGHSTRAAHSGSAPARDADDDESPSTSRYNLTETPVKAADSGESPPPTSRHSAQHVSEVDHDDTKASRAASHRYAADRETDREKPRELKTVVDLQVQSTKPSSIDPVDLQQQQKTMTTTTTRVTESVRPPNVEPGTSDGKSSQVPSRQKSETYTAVKTTSAFEVQLREKPKGSQPVARPSSYAYTPSTRQPDTFPKSDAVRPSARVEARIPAASSSSREPFTSRPLDRTQNPSGTGNANRDRKVKSTFELNIEKAFPPDKGRPSQKAVGGDGSSSSRFKQTLSLFQSKETEGGGVGPVKALPPSLSTQRSVGRISRLPAEDFKPPRSVVEMRRGSAAERRYQPSTETSSSYKTDAARLRGVSRSVQGLDMHRSDFGISDDRWGLRNYGKADVKSAGNSIETSSSRAHSSDEEREKTPQNLSGKNPTSDVDKSLDARGSKGLEADKQETKRYDANGKSDLAGVSARSSLARKETLDFDSQGKVIVGRQNDHPSVSRYSSLYDPGVHDKSASVTGRNYSTSTSVTDWEKKPGPKSSEPKELYAYKHRSPLMEESIIDSRDAGKQITKDHESTTGGHADKYPEAKGSSHYESRKSEPAVRYDVKESYGRDEHKKTDAAPHRASYQEPEKSASGGLQSYHPQTTTKQTSISDIFSKRSAVIRGKPIGEEAATEPHFSASVVPKVGKGKSPAERQMFRQLEAAVDDTIKEFQNDADRVTSTKSSSVISGDVTCDVTSAARTSGDPYASNRRQYGLERTSYTKDEPVSDRITVDLKEPLSHRRLTLNEEKGVVNKQPAFEVGFSVSDVDKQLHVGRDKMDTRNVDSVVVEKEKREEKGVHHQPSAFEVDFSVSGLEKPRRSGETRMGQSDVVESFAVDKEKHRDNADLLRINDSLIIKGPKEEKRLPEEQRSGLVIEEKESFHNRKIPSGDHNVSVGDHRNAAEGKQTSHQPQDSFRRQEVTIGSVGRRQDDDDDDVDTKSKSNRNEFQIEIDTRSLLSDRNSPDKRAPVVSLSTEPKTAHVETRSVKTTPVGDWESSKGRGNEFQIEIDTRGLLSDRNSPDKRVPAVSLSTEPKTSHVETRSVKTTPAGDWESSKGRGNEFQIEIDTRGLLSDRNSPDKRVPAVSLSTEPKTSHVETRSVKATPTGDLEGSKGHRNEFQIEIDTRGLLSDRNSPEKRIQAVPESDKLRCGLQQELIIEFPESKFKESTKNDVKNDSTEEFYFGMASGTSEDIVLRPNKADRPAEIVVEIPQVRDGQRSRVDLLASQEHRVSRPDEHKLPSLDHKLPSHHQTLPSHEHKLASEENKSLEPKTELKTGLKEHKLSSPDHRLSPIPSQEKKTRPEEHKTPSLDHKSSPLEPKILSEEHKLSSRDQKLPSDEHKLPSKEPPKIPSSDRKLPSVEDNLSSLEHRLAPLPSEEHRAPSQQRDLPSSDRVMNRNSKIGLVLDLDSHPDGRPSAGKHSSADKVIIAELDTLLDGTTFDVNSNIPTDTKRTNSPPRSTPIFQEEPQQHPSTFDPSTHDKATPKISVAVTPVDKKRISGESNGFLASAAVDEEEPASEPDPKSSPAAPKKKPPAPPPKTKPKTAKASDESTAEKDDWGFLSSSQRLDVSANKDKCRLLTTAPMGAKRRPKSAMFSQLETSDPFGLESTTPGDQNGHPMEDDDHGKKVDSPDGNPAHVAATPTPASTTPLEPTTAATRLRNKGIRPVSYMDELNSSLFKKKNKETATPSDDEEAEPQPPSSTRHKKNDDDGKPEGEAEVQEGTGAEKATSGARIRIPGLMDELNISLKKKRPENVRDSREEEEKNIDRKQVSAEVATGDLLNFSDDKDSKDDVEEEAPPPPLPNVPPPLPNWSAFPGSAQPDPILGLPPGPPPRPPSGPPPDQSLIDLSFSEDEPGQIHFRTTGMSHLQGDGSDKKAFQSDDMDFSFA